MGFSRTMFESDRVQLNGTTQNLRYMDKVRNLKAQFLVMKDTVQKEEQHAEIALTPGSAC